MYGESTLSLSFIMVSYSCAGVLSARLEYEWFSHPVEVEIHVCSPPQDADHLRSEAGARVAHIVVRLSTDHDAWDNTIQSIQGPAVTLSRLRTIIVETSSSFQDETRVKGLSSLDGTGKLRQRTCHDAMKIAHQATKDPAAYAEDWDVVSPVWCLGTGERDYELDWARRYW